jgi:hypothetical protein
MNGSRAEILGRIRLALSNPALEHHHGHQPEIRIFAALCFRLQHDSLVEQFRGIPAAAAKWPFVLTPSVSCNRDLINLPIWERLLSLSAVAVDFNSRGLRAELRSDSIYQRGDSGENSFERSRLRSFRTSSCRSPGPWKYLIADIEPLLRFCNPQANREISLLASISL